MVDGNAFAREFREASSKLRPRQLEAEDEADVSEYVRGASETFAFVAMRLAGEDRTAFDRWLNGVLEQAFDTLHHGG